MVFSLLFKFLLLKRTYIEYGHVHINFYIKYICRKRHEKSSYYHNDICVSYVRLFYFFAYFTKNYLCMYVHTYGYYENRRRKKKQNDFLFVFFSVFCFIFLFISKKKKMMKIKINQL